MRLKLPGILERRPQVASQDAASRKAAGPDAPKKRARLQKKSPPPTPSTPPASPGESFFERVQTRGSRFSSASSLLKVFSRDAYNVEGDKPLPSNAKARAQQHKLALGLMSDIAKDPTAESFRKSGNQGNRKAALKDLRKGKLPDTKEMTTLQKATLLKNMCLIGYEIFPYSYFVEGKPIADPAVRQVAQAAERMLVALDANSATNQMNIKVLAISVPSMFGVAQAVPDKVNSPGTHMDGVAARAKEAQLNAARESKEELERAEKEGRAPVIDEFASADPQILSFLERLKARNAPPEVALDTGPNFGEEMGLEIERIVPKA